MNNDLEHLRLLSIFHYIIAVLAFLGGLAFASYIGIGLLILQAPFEPASGQEGQPPPQWFGWIFVGIGVFLTLAAWTVAGLVVAAGRCLAGRRRRMFCMVIAGILCLCFPFGTVLGVFTLVVLSRPSVRDLFDATAPAGR